MSDQSPTTGPWRVAGALALAHTVCFALAVAIGGPPTVHPGQEGIEHSFRDGPLSLVFTAGFVNTVGFLTLLPVMVFLTSALGRRTALGRWGAETAGYAGLGAIVVIVGTGFASGAAAAWGRSQGLELQTTLAINNIQNFAYLLALPLLGTLALGFGIGAVSGRLLTRWVGWGGIGVGAALLLAVPAAGAGIQYGMPLWLLWWTGVGVSLMRHRPTASPTPASTETLEQVAR